MALEAQASPSPRRSPPRAPDAAADPPAREAAAGDEWPDPEDPPAGAGAAPPGSPPADPSTAVVVASRHHASAAKYVPPRAASRTADPDPARAAGWYSWSGRRSAPPPPRRARPDPPPPRRQRPAEVAPPPPQPQAPAPAPPPAPVHAPAPPPTRAPAPPPAQVRSADPVVSILSRKRRAAVMQCTALVARGAAAGLCLAALAVLAADTRKGWARDSYSNYSQFRYSEAVNVIGFVYSVFQFAALVGLMRNNQHLISHPKRGLFDFTMDQVLAYLLISSSSSATARVGDLIDNWGSDPFPSMANGSIAISFMAFIVFAICSLISANNLFRRDM
ncbi:hypothetical protein SEVIR_1G094000v4 [Setaria viridis]|uniref:CASP-like protein n=1 Tax=Setaria viridis TaxID=4556 RepID=A0A4U6WB11_SETVI|nr:CASP-like protein 4A2 [Setaria viridis]TKW38129.1 hypothetical protein SEVIR_1G094000v2 [Setaria viridis]